MVHSAVSDDKPPPPWTPVDWKTLPQANPDDQVSVYYLVSPLLEEDFGDILKYINLYHGAIGFRNHRTNFSITINYDADDFFRNSLFPEVVKYDNGTRDLVWVNQGGSFIYLDINYTYWEAGIYETTVVNGTLYNMYISDFNSAINATYPFYNLFSVLEHFGATPWLPSWDCFDFIWSSFRFFADNGAVFDPNLKLKRNFANIYSSQPPIDYTELANEQPQIRENIIEFFEFIELKLSDLSLVEIFAMIVEVFDGQFYVRYDDQYWLAQLQFPYFAIDYEVQPLPGKL